MSNDTDHHLDRWVGWAGLAFLASLIAQNALRGAYVPMGDVAGPDLRTYAVDHRWVIEAIDALVALNAACLAVFVGGLYQRTRRAAPTWAAVGLVGATAIFGLFLTTVALEAAIAARASAAADETLQTLWAIHNGVFAMVLIAVAIALLGLGKASVAAELLPRWFDVVAPLAAVLMLAGGAMAVPITEGSAVLAVGGIGFLGWMAFLLVAGLRLVRGPQPSTMSASISPASPR